MNKVSTYCCQGITMATAIIGLMLFSSQSLAEPYRGPLILEGASIYGDQVVFASGGKLWQIPRLGGLARAITTGQGRDSQPVFSFDGRRLAFLRRNENLVEGVLEEPGEPFRTRASYDVYVRSMSDGKEKRLTYHPARDFPIGWTPDSQHILLNSNREGPSRLFTMGVQDQLPVPLALPYGYSGSFSPDGKRLAYLPKARDYHFAEFRYYRGGECSPLWIVDLDSGALERISDDSCNARDPIWIGDQIYFLSDREGAFDLYVYNLKAKTTRKLTDLSDSGIRHASGDWQSIVMGGRENLYLFDLSDETTQAIEIGIELDRRDLRPRIVNAVSQIQSVEICPNGNQATICARGDVLLADLATGEVANITKSTGVAEREARLSPDGKTLAYFSDASGEYVLTLRDTSSGVETKLPIEPQPTFYRELVWSPTSKHLAFSDKRLAVWLADIDAGRMAKIDHSSSSAQGLFQLNWSPSGEYLAYSKYGTNRLPAIYVYELPTGNKHLVTEENNYARSPVFDRGGRYLYFLSSPNAPAADFQWGVMSGVHALPLVVRHLNAIVLSSHDPAPVTGSMPNLKASWSTSGSSNIDFDGIQQRVVPISVGEHLPIELAVGEAGVIYISDEQWSTKPGSGRQSTREIFRLDLRSPSEFKKVFSRVTHFSVAADGKSLLCDEGPNLRLASLQATKVQTRPISLGAIPVPVDPEREWRQIFHEAWRIMRDYFYDPNHHGMNWKETGEIYARFLPGIGTREDLNVLMRRMLGHVSVSHLGVGGGDLASNIDQPEPVGLLGAELEVSDGLYRITRVFRSNQYDAAKPTYAPLAQIGSEVEDGEYLLAIDDRPIDATKNIYDSMKGKVSRPVRLLVGKTPDSAKARTVVVLPIANDVALRAAAWAQENVRKVDALSGGRLGYFHVPTWGQDDIHTFNHGFYATLAKPGVIIDQRDNGGGITPDLFVDMLARKQHISYLFRDGDDLAFPANRRDLGTTVLLINERNGSAAETFALMFQLASIGPTVGQRTGGGGIGPYGAATPPQLIDGGRLRIPARGAYDPAGRWRIENEGISPDISVEITPSDWLAGRDSQLEAAVTAGLATIENHPPSIPKKPVFPVHP